MAKKKAGGAPGLEAYVKDIQKRVARVTEARNLEESGKLKVCVTYIGPKARPRKTCRILTKRQIAKLVGIPKGLKISSVTRF